MLCFTGRGKLAKKVLIIIVLLVVPGIVSAQNFRIEGEAGLSLFNFSDPILEADLEGFEGAWIPYEKMEIDLTHKNSFFIGAYGGYILGPVEIGGELSFTNSKGTSADIRYDTNTDPDTAGRYDFKFFKIGPVIRYYFNNANPQIEPFAGATVSYVGASIDIDDPSLKIEQTYLDIGFLGGALYWMEENFYIGGMARIDIYKTNGTDDVLNMDVDAPDNVDILNITTNGWTPLSLFLVIGTKL